MVASTQMPGDGCASRWTARRMSLVPLALAAAVAIAACGGGGGNSSTTTSSSKAASAPRKPKATPVQLVDQTFTASNAVQSGHLDLTATVTLNGVKQLGSQPITVHVSGPFVQGANGKPNTALTISLSLAGKNLDLAVDQIDGTSYLGISGTFYKLPASALKPPAGATGAAGRLKGLFTSLGIDPRQWLTNPHDVGTADVGGVSTEHLTAQVDLPKLLADVTRLAAGLSSS